MKKINDYFDKIYVLTVGATEERINTLKIRLEGLNFEIFEGTDGRKYLPQIESLNKFPKEFFIENKIDSQRFNILSKGQLGCSLSHIEIYKKIVKSSYNRTLILEDDAFIEKKDYCAFDKLIEKLPANWELLYLGYKDVVKKQRTFPVLIQKIYHLIKKNKIYNIPFGKDAKGFYSTKEKYYLKSGVYLATYGYAIDLQGAKKVLEYCLPVRFLADELLMDMVYNNKILSFVSKEPLINHSYNFQSST